MAINKKKDIAAKHDRICQLACHGKTIERDFNIPDDNNSRGIRNAINKYYHNTNKDNNIQIHVILLEQLDIVAVPPNWDPNIKTSSVNQLHYSVSSQSRAKGVNAFVKVAINEKQDSYKLEIPLVMLEKATQKLIRQMKNRRFPIEELIEQSINLAASYLLIDKYNPPLHAAATVGDKEVLDHFLDEDFDQNEQAFGGWTPLLMATANGHADMVKKLLDNGADPNIPNVLNRTPLHYAARYGDVKILKMLLDYGANINLQDDDGNTPLCVAIKMKHVPIVTTLLTQKPNIEIKNLKGITALDLAYKTKQGKIARLLRKSKI